MLSFLPPQSHLIGYLSQDLISEAGIGQSSLDDVVPKQILLSSIQVRVPHEPKYLSTCDDLRPFVHIYITIYEKERASNSQKTM